MMASRRKLKKHINNLCFKVTGECFTFLEHTPSLNQENVQLIIADAVELRNRLVYMLNNPQPATGNTRMYYRDIRKELHENTRELIGRLNSLPR